MYSREVGWSGGVDGRGPLLPLFWTVTSSEMSSSSMVKGLAMVAAGVLSTTLGGASTKEGAKVLSKWMLGDGGNPRPRPPPVPGSPPSPPSPLGLEGWVIIVENVGKEKKNTTTSC